MSKDEPYVSTQEYWKIVTKQISKILKRQWKLSWYFNRIRNNRLTQWRKKLTSEKLVVNARVENPQYPLKVIHKELDATKVSPLEYYHYQNIGVMWTFKNEMIPHKFY